MNTEHDLPEFSDKELRASLQRIGAGVRQSAFIANRPYVVLKNGKVVAVFRDKRQVIIEPACASSQN